MLQFYSEFEHLINAESLYWFCAFLGSGMFIIQFILNLFLGIEHDDLDEGGLADAGKFKWLSRQAVTGFLMMFGWTAITCQKEFEIVGIPRVAISLAIGLLAMIITAYIFKIAQTLHSSGNVFRIEEAVGKEGFVYQRIPREGMGKILFSLNEMTQEINAISHDNQEVLSFTQIKIIRKLDDQTVVVEAIEERKHA